MTIDFQDYYKHLGGAKTATQEEIRSAFRKLARQYHPDVAADKAEAEERFKEINEAYEVLGDAEKRKKYDAYEERCRAAAKAAAHAANFQAASHAAANGVRAAYGKYANGREAPRAPKKEDDFQFSGTGFSDFFERLFGVRQSKREAAAKKGGGFGFGAERGQDIEADFLVRLEETLNGATRTITFRRSRTGKTETYAVKIPKGVREGQKIRLAGVGEQGRRGGPPGDLYLRVKLQQHPDFRVQGFDLYHEIEVPVYRLVLGTEIEIPTLEGKARIKIPPGSQGSQRFRLGGRGLPTETPGLRGDLFVTLVPTLPKRITPEELKLWREIERMNQQNPSRETR